jgi:hypothetical protein
MTRATIQSRRKALYDAAARGKRWTLEMRRELVVLTARLLAFDIEERVK